MYLIIHGVYISGRVKITNSKLNVKPYRYEPPGAVWVAPDSHIGPITGISDRRPIWTLISAINAPCISVDIGLISARSRR